MAGQNRKQRRAASVLQRKSINRSRVGRIQGIEGVEVPEGTLIIIDRVIHHPLYGDIHLVVDETMQESLATAHQALQALRRIPLQFAPATVLTRDDPYVKWYVERDFPFDHAQELAAAAYKREDQDAYNSAGLLAAFSYIDFEGDPPEDKDWQTPEEMERFDSPPRPVRLDKASQLERKVSFIKDLLYTGNETDKVDEDGEPVPSFQAQFMTFIGDMLEHAQALAAGGVIDGEEPVDGDGFPGEPVDSDVHAADDAASEEAE
jgi:hypothetical protein